MPFGSSEKLIFCLRASLSETLMIMGKIFGQKYNKKISKK
jgi:hypothetical protein